jgi:hypothetical protein
MCLFVLMAARADVGKVCTQQLWIGIDYAHGHGGSVQMKQYDPHLGEKGMKNGSKNKIS